MNAQYGNGTRPEAGAPSLDWARWYLANGWPPIPVPIGQKGPRMPGWQNLRPTEADLPDYFRNGCNIGVLLGEPSNGRIDVDLDAPEAIALADGFLPKTKCVHGRPGKPRSHRWYLADPIPRTEQFTAPDGRMICEIRSTGGQTIVPPSRHPCGETLAWEHDEVPRRVSPAELRKAVGLVASCALIARHWPEKGNRHNAALALSGFLVRGGIDEQLAATFIQLAARTANDEEWQERERAVFDTARTLANGEPVTGGPTLEQVLKADAEKVLAKLREWMEMDGGRDQSIPALDAGDLDLPKVTEAAWKAIIAANNSPSIFRHASAPARIENDDAGDPVVRPLTLDRLRHHLARAANWYKLKKVGDETRQVPALPPVHVSRDMLARPDPPLLVLLRIVQAPVFCPDGTLHTDAGYHPLGRVYFAPAAGLSVPTVPENPSSADINGARQLVMEELLGDFPFVGDADRAHAVALFLLPFLRALIDGRTPLHLIEKPTPGTGAGLLVNVLAFPASGREAGVMTEGRDEDEWRKRITSQLVCGSSMIVIDNLRRRLESSAVAAAITAPIWEDRRLGSTEMVRIPVQCAWVGTGNNPALSGEIARRTIRIRLDAKVDRPWERKDFRHPDLVSWSAEHRSDLMWAALTLGRAWLAAGRPVGRITLGMFENWARVISGVLDVAKIPGFLANRGDFYEKSDAEGAELRAFVTVWWDQYADKEVGISDLWTLLAPEGDDPIDLPVGDGSERSQKPRLGKLLGAMRDRQFGEIRIKAAGTRARAQLWHLVRKEGKESR